MADDTVEETCHSDTVKRLKLVIFGATGATGQELVKQALDDGHEVTAIARDPTKLDIKHDSLKVVKADALKIDQFDGEMSGKDAVMSCLGTRSVGPFATTTIYSETIKPVFESMKKHGVKRLVTLTSWCTRVESNNPWYFEWFLRPMLLKGPLKDMVVMESIIENTQPDELNYTIVRPPRLNYEPFSGNYKIEEGLYNTSRQTKAEIPRADVAHFMLKALQTNEYDRKEISIATSL